MLYATQRGKFMLIAMHGLKLYGQCYSLNSIIYRE